MKQKKSAATKNHTEVYHEVAQVTNGVVSKKRFIRIIPIILVVVLLVLLGVNKGLFVASLVNGKPIFTWQLHNTLRARFGQQTLEGMIGEMLIKEEAKKAKIVVTKKDIEAKEKEIVSSLGSNVSLDDLLKFQGLSKSDFEKQVALQLTVEKLLAKDLIISESDIDAYTASQSTTLVATEPAAMRIEAKQAIVANTVADKLQTWFAELRKKAKVLRFL